MSNSGLLRTEEDFPPILMYWASVILTARICKPSVTRFAAVQAASLKRQLDGANRACEKVLTFRIIYHPVLYSGILAEIQRGV